VLGRMNMGQAHAKLVATSAEIQLNDFTADIFKGQASGSARIAITKRATSHVTAAFNGLDIAGPLTALAQTPVPLSGRATGKVDLSFPGTDFKQATGTITTQLTAETGETTGDRIPITGDVALRADRGTFDIQQLNLQTPASKLKASGQFSFNNDSNLQVDLTSSDAAELQTLFISFGDLEEQLSRYGIGLAGQLAFNGTVKGKLTAPDFNGRFMLGSLIVNGTDLGALSAAINMNAAELQIADGRLTEKDGGGLTFSLTAPRTGADNIALNATLDRVNAKSIFSVLGVVKPDSSEMRYLSDTQSDVSGQIKITGIPNAMNGVADLRFGPGRFAGEPLESLVARATFNGANVIIENIDVRLQAGHIVASGTYNNTSKAFDLQGKAEGIQLARLAALASKPGLPVVTGVGDFTAHVSGILGKDFSAYQINFDGQGRDVTINGRSAGSLTLVGKTENKQLSITLTTGVLGSPQVIAAQINLAEERLPATIETTLTNADLSSLFGIALPQSTVKFTGRASGTIKASGNLVNEDNDFSLAGLTGTASSATRRTSSVRTSTRAGHFGVPTRRASFSAEIALIDDMARPFKGMGRDASACRLVGRSHSPWREYTRHPVGLSSRRSAQTDGDRVRHPLG